MIEAALKFGEKGVMNPPSVPLERLGSFKPFNIKEFDVETFDR